MLSEFIDSFSTFFSDIFPSFKFKKDTKILMTGLDSAGKSTIFEKLKLGFVISITPVIGFNFQTIKYKNLTIIFGNTGGCSNLLRSLWKRNYHGSNAIIFVVDSSDRDRMDQVKEEIDNLLIQDELKGVPILIFANKQDINNTMSTTEIVNSLNLNSIEDRKWYIQLCSAIKSDGVYEGINWIVNLLNK
ncbi:hypothetical protein ACTFIZ_008794 [Dictyostelium cf. discoideum]